jgi:hypothetical protein
MSDKTAEAEMDGGLFAARFIAFFLGFFIPWIVGLSVILGSLAR